MLDNETKTFFSNVIEILDGVATKIAGFLSYHQAQEDDENSRPKNCFHILKKEDMKYKGIKIRKRKDDRWYARVPINPGYYKYIYGKTQELCLKNLKDYLKDYSSETTKTKNRMTFSDFYQTWLENEKKPFIKEKSYKTLKLIYKNYLYIFEKKPLLQITANDVRSLINSTNYPNVKRKIYLTLRDLFRKAIQYDIVATSPIDKVTAPAIKKKKNAAGCWWLIWTL